MAESKYSEEMLLYARQYAADGLSAGSIAHNLGICRRTFYKYRREHHEFDLAVSKGQQILLGKAEAALTKLALGGCEMRVSTIRDGVVTETIKTLPPNLRALTVLLKRLCPEEWDQSHHAARASGGADDCEFTVENNPLQFVLDGLPPEDIPPLRLDEDEIKLMEEEEEREREREAALRRDTAPVGSPFESETLCTKGVHNEEEGVHNGQMEPEAAFRPCAMPGETSLESETLCTKGVHNEEEGVHNGQNAVSDIQEPEASFPSLFPSPFPVPILKT